MGRKATSPVKFNIQGAGKGVSWLWLKKYAKINMRPAYCCIIFNFFPSKIMNKNKISTMQIQNRYNSGWKGFQEVSSPTSLLDGKYTSPDHSQIPDYHNAICIEFPQTRHPFMSWLYSYQDSPGCCQPSLPEYAASWYWACCLQNSTCSFQRHRWWCVVTHKMHLLICLLALGCNIKATRTLKTTYQRLP